MPYARNLNPVRRRGFEETYPTKVTRYILMALQKPGDCATSSETLVLKVGRVPLYQ